MKSRYLLLKCHLVSLSVPKHSSCEKETLVLIKGVCKNAGTSPSIPYECSLKESRLSLGFRICMNSVFSSAISTVGCISVDPEANLGVLERSDAYGHVKVLLNPVRIHPLVA